MTSICLCAGLFCARRNMSYQCFGQCRRRQRGATRNCRRMFVFIVDTCLRARVSNRAEFMCAPRAGRQASCYTNANNKLTHLFKYAAVCARACGLSIVRFESDKEAVEGLGACGSWVGIAYFSLVFGRQTLTLN